MKRKKLVIGVFAMLLCFVVAGCGKTTNGQKTDKTKTTEKAAEKKENRKRDIF